ncbi:hypothetical protein OIU78_028964 [Salix suchowensis]|nr:hypothetical protein OIU78_028964 [Salix suchowensis]
MTVLSGLLNFIDGLWSSCGDERIIVFTTGHKENPRPCSAAPGTHGNAHSHVLLHASRGFRVLASNYLGNNGNHRLFGEIEGLTEDTEVTPAQVAGRGANGE